MITCGELLASRIKSQHKSCLGQIKTCYFGCSKRDFLPSDHLTRHQMSCGSDSSVPRSKGRIPDSTCFRTSFLGRAIWFTFVMPLSCPQLTVGTIWFKKRI